MGLAVLHVWGLYILLTLLIVYSGSRLTLFADRIAVRLGITRTWVGLTLVAGVTSLPDLAMGLTAAGVYGTPNLAVGGALGAVMLNLLIIVWLDLLWGPRSLYAHNPANLRPAMMAVPMLAVVIVGLAAGPRIPALGWISPLSLVLLIGYLWSMRRLFAHHGRPAVAAAVPDGAATLRASVAWFALHAVVVLAAAAFLPRIGAEIAEAAGLTRSFVGTTFLAATATLPELVVATTALRMRALDLAIGNELGSNLFDLMLLGLADVVFVRGPLLAAVSPVHLVSAAGGLAMTLVVAAGLRWPLAKRMGLSWPSLLLVVLYAVALALVGLEPPL